MEGRDGKIRGATVRVITNGKPNFLNRPLSRLYPLVVYDDHPQSENNFNEKMVQVLPQRPKRKAALQADLLREMREKEFGPYND